MGSLRQRRVLSGVTVKRRKSWLLAASALAPLSLGVSEPALAACSGGFTLDCTAGTYTSSINVSTGPAQPLSITLQPGVNVTIPAGSPGVNAVNAANTTGPTATSAPITITANGVILSSSTTTIPLAITRPGCEYSPAATPRLTATNTTINLSGTASDFALYAIVLDGGAPHNASVNLTQGTVVTSSGNEAGAIQADNRGTGNATVVASGAITVTPNAGVANGTTQYGLLAHAERDGNASVTFNSGTLDVSAVRPRGILAWVDGNGSATVNTGAGTVINVSGTQFGGPGVYLFSSAATATNALTANVASLIKSVGPANTDPSNLPVGIRANNSGTNAPIVVNYTGPGITVEGGNGVGILAQSGSGSINVMTSVRANHDDRRVQQRDCRDHGR